MIKLTQVLNDPNGIVSKLIFEDEGAIAEAVAYRYEERGVVCFSVQSGCRVGCLFCGTGKKFIRDLSHNEMLLQIEESLKVIGRRPKIEIMSMSMGEPMDNWYETKVCINSLMDDKPLTRFYLSTTGLNKPEAMLDILELGMKHPNFGLQFSLHCADENKRKKLLGDYSELLTLPNLISYGKVWKAMTGKRVYYNYIAKEEDAEETSLALCKLVEGQHLTCSVLCNTHEMKVGVLNPATRLAAFVNGRTGYDIDVSVFNPAGQDTVGGGCGQLLYVQKKLKGL